MILVLYSVALYRGGQHDETMLILLDEASITGSMVATLSHFDNSAAPQFVVSLPER